MGGVAVLFALSEQEIEAFLAVPRLERSDYLHDVIEDVFFDEYPQYVQELETSWNAMHRMLTDGSLSLSEEFLPYCNVILGGEILYGMPDEEGSGALPEKEYDEYIILKTPEQVREVAAALAGRTREECRRCYEMMDQADYENGVENETENEKSSEDFEYTWACLQESIAFWTRAAGEGRYVVFTVDR